MLNPQVFSEEAFRDRDIHLTRWSPQHMSWGMEIMPASRLNTCYQFFEVYTSTTTATYQRECMNVTSVVVSMTIQELVSEFKFLSLKNLIRLAEVHSVWHRGRNKKRLLEDLSIHQCSSLCGVMHVIIFKVLIHPRSVPSFIVLPSSAGEGTGGSQLPAEAETVRQLRTKFSTVETRRVAELMPKEDTVQLVVATAEEANADRLTDPNGPDKEMRDKYDHLEVLSKELKHEILSSWEKEFSTEVLSAVTCSSCGEDVLPENVDWQSPDVNMLNLLRNPALHADLRPTEYAFELYNCAVLDWKGLENRYGLGRIRVCRRCMDALTKGKMPRFALANDLYTARHALPIHIKDSFDNITPFEIMLISRARFNTICCKFRATAESAVADGHHLSAKAKLARARKGVRGNIMVVPLDTIRMNKVLPPNTSTIRDTMCAVFVGSSKPTADFILSSKASPALVRKSRVKNMIMFLMDKNPFYKPNRRFFEFSDGNLNALHSYEDEGVPGSVEIGFIEADKVVNVSTADYTPRNEDGSADEAGDDFLMENVGYTDGDTSVANLYAMKALAIEHCKANKRFIVSGTGNTPVPDFDNPSILTWLFPHLDPWGIAGFNHPGRRIKLTVEEQLNHFLRSSDKQFQRDAEFSFVFFNILRKMNVSRSMRFSVQPAAHHRLAADMMAIDPETLQTLSKKYFLNPLYKPTDEKERKACDVMASLTMIARQIPGSNGYKVSLRNQIRALIAYRGTPTIFITINPADVDSPVVRLMAGDNINLEDITRGEDMDSFQRRMFAANNPSACAQYFHHVMTRFIKLVLKYGCGPSERGVFGVCDAYYGTVEAQGKGTLHCHMLLWLRGHLSPQRLRDAMLESDEYRERVIQWVESVIKCEFPVDDAAKSFLRQPLERQRHSKLGNPNPGTVPAPYFGLDRPSGQYNMNTFNHYLSELLHEYQWHVHNETCWKYLRPGEAQDDQNCRLRMNGELREETTLDMETGALLLRRHHPYIAAYNDVITVMLKCNVELKFIGSGRAARDLVFYITDYVTKPTLPVHVGMAALRYAIAKVSDRMAQTSENFSVGLGTSAIITAVNSVMGRNEISQPQVMSYLIGGGDHYTSAKFCTLNWGDIIRYVEAEISRDANVDEAANERPLLGETLMAVDIRSDSVTASTQTLDYMFRSVDPIFDSLCLYDFAGRTYKTVIRKKLRQNKKIEDIPGSFSSWDHPQRGSHQLVLRRENHVPVLLGPTIPNPEQSLLVKEKWAKYVLVLFKPWRQVSEIKGQHGTYAQAYEEYQAGLSHTHREIIRNMNAFAESKDARENIPRRSVTRRDDLSYLTDTMVLMDDGVDSDLLGDAVDIGGNISMEARVPLDVFLFTHTSRYGDIFSDIMTAKLGSSTVNALDLCYESRGVSDPPLLQDCSNKVTVADLKVIVERQTYMRLQKMKRNVHEIEDSAMASNATPAHRRRGVVDAFVDIMTIDSVESRFPKRLPGSNVEQLRSGVVESMNLGSNEEQLRAFNIVGDHLISRDSEQLLMYVAGVGGTGKSHLIQSIVKLFVDLGVREQLLLGAPTGIAAVLIGGQTLHSLAQLTPGKKSKALEKLTAAWKDVRYVIIDEVSMIGARFLSQFSNRLREAKYHYPESCSKPFGGINVIFMGDFGQLKPAAQTCLYAHSIIKHPSFMTGSSVGGIDAMNGILLWRQVTQVVTLQRNQRHAGDLDYAAFLSRIRLGICQPHAISLSNGLILNDWEFLLSRLMENMDESTVKLFKDAPIIVGNKATRDMLNTRCIIAHSAEMKQSVERYYSVDTIKRVPIAAGLREKLWDMPSSDSNEALGRLPLFAGMKVMVTENIAFAIGIVNGTEGTIESIQHNEDSSGRRTAVVAYVRVPGCQIHLDGLEPEIVPIYPVATHIDCPTSLEYHGIRGFTRKQLPLVPGYAYTDFKSQGRTLERAIVDLYTARGQGVYVMLSRVKSLAGLAILRWFPPSKVYSRLPQELREEFSRIDGLTQATIDRRSCVNEMISSGGTVDTAETYDEAS